MTDETEKPRRPKGERRAGKPVSGKMRERGRPARHAAPTRAEDAGGERIAKRLARAGIASRREAEALIADGRVRVNGQVLSSPAFNVAPGDRIELDGTEIPAPERTRLFLFHKPAGVVTTNRDPEGRKTVFDVLPAGLPRVMTVGRLDINTEGLLLLTNDGGLARVLELPATGWLRRYRVRVHGEVDEARLGTLREGIAVDGVFYGSIEAELERRQGSNAWLTLALREGKNREVKNVLGALGLDVTRLIRVSYGPFQLSELAEGHVQELKGRMLRDQLGERLIEEAGADFEADIRKPFTNRPTALGNEPETPKERPAAPRPEPGEGGLIKNRKRERERFRADALDRLGTKPKRFGERGRSFGKEEGEKKPERPRAANVWMAPGARPQGRAKPAAAGRTEKPFAKPFRTRSERNEGDAPSDRRERPARDRTENAGPGRDFRRVPRRAEDGEKTEKTFKPRRPRDEQREGGGAPVRRERPARPEGAAEGGDLRRPSHRNENGERPEKTFRPRRQEGDAGPPRRPGSPADRPPPRREDRPPRQQDREGGERGFSERSGREGPRKPFVKNAAGGKSFRPSAKGQGDGAPKPFRPKPRRLGEAGSPGPDKPSGATRKSFKRRPERDADRRR